MKKPYLINIKKVGDIMGCDCVTITFHKSKKNQRVRDTYYKKIGTEYRKLFSDEIEKIKFD